MPRVSKKDKAEAAKIVCIRCGSSNQSDFYKTKDIERKFFEKIPYCKKCVKVLYNQYMRKYKDQNLAIYYLCRKIDIPYNHNCYLGALDSISNASSKIYGEEGLISAYMKGLAFSDTNGWGNTFDDSQGENDIEGLASYNEVAKVKKKFINIDDNSDDFEEIKYDRAFLQGKWGLDDPDDLAYLESEYLDWEAKLGGKIEEKNIETLIKQICHQSLEVLIARRTGASSVDKKVKTLRELLSDAGLTAKQKDALKGGGNRTMGMEIADIEKRRPIVSVDPEFSDIDNMSKLLVGFVGSLSRTLGKENKWTDAFKREYKDYELDIVENLSSDTINELTNIKDEDLYEDE